MQKQDPEMLPSPFMQLIQKRLRQRGKTSRTAFLFKICDGPECFCKDTMGNLQIFKGTVETQ